MATILAVPTIYINNQAIFIVPNSCSFTEGLGEQSMRVQSAGGNVVQQVYSANVESNLSILKFKIYATQENIELAKTWKQNANNNAVSLTGQTTANAQPITRYFNNAALTANYEVNAQTDGELDIEFQSDQAV